MTTYEHTPQTKTLLRTFQWVSLTGLVLVILQLRQGVEADNWRMLIYGSWFVISIISVEAVLHWLKTGVYVLAGATLAVTAVDIALGYATMMGASLGLLIAFVIIVYLYPVWIGSSRS